MTSAPGAALAPEVVGPLFLDGVAAVERWGGGLTGAAWRRPACGEWDAEDTARHLLAVAGWYHEWLERAEAGEVGRPFPHEELPARNAAAIAERSDVAGADAVVRFAEAARRYLDRASDAWDLPFGYPFGVVTVGLHCGVAATEWHLHAWDLARSAGGDHVPSDPAGLFRAASRCVAAAEGGMAGAALRVLAPLGARARPWPTLLTRSGRQPVA